MKRITSKKADAAQDKELKRIWRGEETHFDEAVNFLSAEARYFVLDAISCGLHNEGYGLEGNTEANDTLWLARNLYERADGQRLTAVQWDNLQAEDKDHWVKLAEVTIGLLPRLADRIASRYIGLKKALNVLLRREKYYRMRGYTYADEKPDEAK